MPNWIRDSGRRLVKHETPHNKELELGLNIMETTPEDQHSHHGHQDNPNEFRSMMDRMHPPRMSAPSCIVPPIEQLVIRPHIVQLLPTFHGMESENPYAHIKEFEDVCNTFQEGGASIDLMRLKLFHFTNSFSVSFTRSYFSIAFNLVLVNRTLFGSFVFVFLCFCFFSLLQLILVVYAKLGTR